MEAIQGGEKFLLKHKPTLYMEAKKDEEGTKILNGFLIMVSYVIGTMHFGIEKIIKNNNKLIHDHIDMNIAVPEKNKQPTNLLN